MTDLRVYQIDAFTTERFQGNPAGVVANADGLSDREMLLIARELNNSETAFIFRPTGDGHDVHVRFFTPSTEVPVCGHATVSAHYVMAIEGRPSGWCRQLTGAGIQNILTARDADDLRITMQQNRPTFEPPISPALVGRVADALGVDREALDLRCPVQFVSTGHGKLLIGVREHSTLQGLVPDPAKLVELGGIVGTKGYFVFTLDTPDDAMTWGRMFAPSIGISEDPVTGNANGPLGAYLVKHGLISVHAGHARYRARQTAATGRTGWMDVSVSAEGGDPVAVSIEGRAVLCFSTTLPRS